MRIYDKPIFCKDVFEGRRWLDVTQMKVIALMLVALFAGGSALAAWQGNQPCSGKKGGIARCEGGKFVCKDGTISKSKTKCQRTVK
jgi:hypothetical protein